ncbi:MAG: carbamoyltransferase HypF [Acidilobaceae archaeon]
MGRETGGSEKVDRKVKALRLAIVGIVQGVGFRPFVFRLATSLGLRGYVKNLGGSEVEIWVEGDEISLATFLKRLLQERPPSAKIESVKIEDVEPRGYTFFEICRSGRDKKVRSSIPPDIAICHHCMKEVLEPNTRFTNYYWNSCAWCGPRFSMIYELPYDRENTAMKDFPLCGDCRKDYEDPNNVRRFHAQGISCKTCGPKTYVYSNQGEKLNVEDPVTFTARAIEEGAIVAIKGIGGYHIACLATKDDVVEELRKRKKRPTKPFALMARDLEIVRNIALVPERAERLLLSPERPIVLLQKRQGAPVSELVAPGLSTIGVMLPYTGFQVLLFSKVKDGFLIMTSGNVHGKPMCTNLECVLKELRDVVDYVIEHERDIVHRVDDSVIRFTDEEPVFLRRGRGYAPAWLQLPFNVPDSIAVGAELQSAGAVAFEDKAVLTQYIGDVDEPEALDDLEKEILWLVRVYDLKPKLVALDMHPLYHSREVAKKLSEFMGAELVEVQHHHAHVAATMIDLEMRLEESVPAIAIDGTGYGADGEIWGGEVLIANYEKFERAGSLRPYVLPGGDSVTLHPVKSLISVLTSYGYDEKEIIEILEKRGLMHWLPRGFREATIFYELAKRGKGLQTTSLGRVLDAFSALLGACHLRTYEGEPAIRLEALADRGKDLGWEAEIEWFDNRLVVSLREVIEMTLSGNFSNEDVARSVLTSLGRALARTAVKISKGRRGVRGDVIVVCGGAAVNTYIVRGAREVAREEGLQVLLPKRVPPNDGSIALGQIAIARFKTSLY